MEIVLATLWLTFGAFLTLPHLDAPPIFARMSIGLCASELFALAAWGVSREDCYPQCPPAADTFHSAMLVQIPLLTAAMFVIAAAYGLFVARRW